MAANVSITLFLTSLLAAGAVKGPASGKPIAAVIAAMSAEAVTALASTRERRPGSSPAAAYSRPIDEWSGPLPRSR
jgi:hypothetical protein